MRLLAELPNDGRFTLDKHATEDEGHPSGADPPGVVGVLVVHGVGRQVRGETLAKLLNGLRRVFPEIVPANLAEGEPITLSGRTVKFYEVYWADLLKGKRVRGSFEINDVLSLAWFPYFNQRYHLYTQHEYSIWKVLWYTVILKILGIALMTMYWGAGLVMGLWQTKHRVALIERARRLRRMTATSARDYAAQFEEINRKVVERPTPLAKLLDDYAADAFNYINSAVGVFSSRQKAQEEFPKDLVFVYREIIDRFYDQLLRARRQDHCQNIQIVSHSLGTLVMYHALRGLRLDESKRTDEEKAAILDAIGAIEHVYTIGSPLEKVRFFWPRLRTEQNLVGARTLPWDNFVSYFDPVAGVLRRFDEWGGVANHHLLGGGFLTGHVVYERSSYFLGTLTEGLLGKRYTLHRDISDKIKDSLVLLGENLAVPVGLLMLLVLGAAVWTGIAMLWPFLVTLPLRLVFGHQVWGPILYYGSLVIGALFVWGFCYMRPKLLAKETIDRFRTNDLAHESLTNTAIKVQAK